MSNQPKDIARLWLTQFDERLGWLEQQIEELGTEDLIALSTALDSRRKRLANYISEMEERTAKQMGAKAIKSAVVTGLEGEMLAVEWKATSRRTEVKRDELIHDVERVANADEHRIDKATGELRSAYESRLDLLKRCFRMEPRWSELTKLGINIDEYAHQEWSFGVKVSKAVTL